MTDTLTFASPQEALDALDTTPQASVYIGGVTVDALAWDAQFDVDSTSTSRLTLPLPRPAVVDANAVIEVQAGHNNLIGTAFQGRIPEWSSDVSNRGLSLNIRPAGWSSLLAYRSRYELVFDGPITLNAFFDALCARMGVPAYIGHTATDPTGTIAITLGGNPQIDDGKVIIAANQTPLSALRSACKPFGYRVYDMPTGVVRLSRVSGTPVGPPVVTFTEGIHPFSMSSSYSIADIINYPDIHGPTYEDEWGASIPIRAFPTPITSNPLIPVNGGVNYQDTQNSWLVTQQMAEIALAVAQNDNAAPSQPVKWEAVAVPGLSVGDVVELDMPSIEASGLYWLMSMDINSANGLTATYEGWAGAGIAMPAGNNMEVMRIQEAPFHIGDEFVPWYAVPSHAGHFKRWNVTIPDRTTANNIRGFHHSTNAQRISGVETPLEVTKWNVYLSTDDPDDEDTRPVTSGKMPTLQENFDDEPPYSEFEYNTSTWVVTDAGYWHPFAVNLSRLDPGDYIFEIKSGEKAGWDDMEARLVYLEIWGRNEPIVIPQEVT